jgi:hypothetical protein
MILAHHGGEGLALAAALGGGGLSAGLLIVRLELGRLIRCVLRR